MKQIKLVIFDCDGVMFDSKNANDAYYNHILAHFGKPEMNKAQSHYVHMNTAKDSVAYLFENDSRWADAEVYRQQLSYLPFIPEMKMEPCLKAFLAFLRRRVKTAVATNRSDTMDRVLKEHGLEGDFDLVVTSLDVTEPKPAPESLLKILDYFDLQALEAIYIGDTEIDETAAKAAGVPLVAYKNRRLSAPYHVDSFKELERMLTRGWQ